MTYIYKCRNASCKAAGKAINVTKPMSDSSKDEWCDSCRKQLSRVYGGNTIKPSGDAIKY